MSNPFIDRSVKAVLQTEPTLTEDDLYIVWFAKTLQNHKALISTDKFNGIYWEVTYNGDREESYVDRYVKSQNSAVSNFELGE